MGMPARSWVFAEVRVQTSKSALVGLILIALSASADDRILIPAPVVERSAVLIGRISILSREEKTFEWDGRPVPCGYIYEGTVVESLRGEMGPVRYFSTRGVDPTAISTEFFVLLVRRSKRSSDTMRSIATTKLSGFERERLLCLSGYDTLIANDDPQSMLPVLLDPQSRSPLGVAFEENSVLIDLGLKPHSMKLDGGDVKVFDWVAVRERFGHASHP